MRNSIRFSRCTVLATFAGMSLAATASAQNSVDAHVVSDEVVPADPKAVEQMDAGLISIPPGPDDVVLPMPMVDDTGLTWDTDLVRDGRAISKDLRTGEVKIGPPAFDPELPMEEQWIAGHPGAAGDLGVDESGYMFGGRNMGALSLISDTTPYPWRANCKLRMRFVDNGGVNRFFVCSGTLIDYKTVLTAGHCIFNRDATINDWAAEVWVYPGYDDNDGGLAFEDEDAPYGFAKSIQLHSWTGWTQNGDFNFDQGYIRLNVPIGGKTGTFGYGYNNNCSFFTTPTHHNASYPAEAAFGWNGRFMYYRFGDFDSCPFTNRVQYDSAGFGGMSGSSSYWIDGGGTRFAYSVASTSDRATYTRHVDFWQGAFEHVRDTIIAGNKPATWDLWALCMESSDTTATAGQPVDDCRFLAVNWSQQGVNSTYNFDVRLSTNDFISSGDTLISNQNFSWNFGATSSVFVNLGQETIPIGMSSGTYWLGALLNVSDASSSNNDSSGEEAHQLTVTAVRDPEAVSCSAPSGTFYHGDSINVAYNVHNNGGASAFNVVVDIRASTNTIISTSDTQLGTVNLGTLNGNTTVANSTNVTLPSSLNGTRYIGFIVTTTSTDAVTNNNTAFDATPITVDGRADLEALSVNAENGSHYQTSSMQVQHSVRNNGTIASGNYSVEVRASTNTIISTFDTLLRTDNYGTLGVGSTRNATVNATIPAVLAPGAYYIGVIVSGGINEDSLGDNTNFDATTITVLECIADWNNDGVINTADFLAYLNDYNAVAGGGTPTFGDPDLGLPFGVLNTADFLAFLNIYNSGCP